MNNSEIVVLKIDKNNFLLVTTLKGHEAEISKYKFVFLEGEYECTRMCCNN